MPRLLFICSYDGTHFSGWQSQATGLGVQDCIEAAIERIIKRRVRITASGRTDAGVHAKAQPFHVDIGEDCRMNDQAWLAALNSHLPASVRVLKIQRVSNKMHARFAAKRKCYEYIIEREAILSPFLHGRVWHLPTPFEFELLKQAFERYVGTHDFRMFAAKRGNEPAIPPQGYFERSIYSVSVTEEGSQIRLRITGSGFMYRMVRMLVGTAHHVARGKMSLDELQQMMDSPSLTEKTRFCAPGQGLYLHQVEYENAESIESPESVN